MPPQHILITPIGTMAAYLVYPYYQVHFTLTEKSNYTNQWECCLTPSPSVHYSTRSSAPVAGSRSTLAFFFVVKSVAERVSVRPSCAMLCCSVMSSCVLV